MQPMQPPRTDPIRDRVVVEPEIVELAPLDDPVLASRERRDLPIHAG
jgi:hypothetical protein